MDRIQLRRDTAANWAAHNPILLEGEPGYETDTKLRKIGDGVNAWNDLPYLAAENIVQELGNDENAVISQKVVSERIFNLEAMTDPAFRAVIDDVSLSGSIVVLKNTAFISDAGNVGNITNAVNWHLGIYKLRSMSNVSITAPCKLVGFYRDYPFDSSTYIGYNLIGVPLEGAKYALFNIPQTTTVDGEIKIDSLQVLQDDNTFKSHEKCLLGNGVKTLIPHNAEMSRLGLIDNYGAITESSLWTIHYYNIPNNCNSIIIEGETSVTIVNNYKPAHFFNSEGKYIGGYYFDNTRTSQISIPDNCTTLALLARNGIQSVWYYQNETYITNRDFENKINNIEDLQYDISEEIIPIEINTGFIGTNGLVQDNQYFNYTFINVNTLSDINNICITAGISSNATLKLVHYYDNDKYLGGEYFYTEPTSIENKLLHIPANATKIGITSSAYYNIILSKKIKSNQLKVKIVEEKIKEELKPINESLIKLSDYQLVEETEKIENAFVRCATGEIGNSPAFKVLVYDISLIDFENLYVSSGIGNNTQLAFVTYFNAANNIIGYEYYYETPTILDKAVLSIPEKTKYIKVNTSRSHNAKIERISKEGYYDVSKINKEVEDLLVTHKYSMKVDISDITKGDFIIRTKYNNDKDIILKYYTNDNGLVSPYACWVGNKELTDSELMISTYNISSHSDSTAPLFSSSVYWHLFAQHGYVVPRLSNTVNMTTADIGAVWKDQLNREYTIGNVTDTEIYLLPTIYKDSNGNDTRGWKTPNDTAITTFYHVSGGVVTFPFNTTNLSSRQLLPIMSCDNRIYMINGIKITKAGTYYCNEFSVSESQVGYDPASINVWFPTPVLDNANEMARFTWSYNFKGANCAVNTTIDIRTRIECQSYGADQQQTFFDKGDYKAMFLIPKAQPQNGIVLDRPFNSPNSSSLNPVFYKTETYLKDINDPIDRLVGFLHNPANNTYLCGMATGLSLVSGDTVKEKRSASMLYGNKNGHYRVGSFSPANTNKFYIAAVNTSEFESDNYHFPTSYFKEINYYVSYFDPAENVGQVYWYKDGNNYIIYMHFQDVYNKQEIKLPDFMEGLKCEIVEKTDGISLLTDTISNGKLFINSNSDANHLVLKTI